MLWSGDFTGRSSSAFAIHHALPMKQFSLSFFTLLALLCGCRSAGTFEPQWLSDPSQVVYSSEYEGNVRVKLKAKVTESEFVAATERLKLIPHTEDNEYAQNLEALRWKRGPDKRWDPLPDVGGTLISHHFKEWRVTGNSKSPTSVTPPVSGCASPDRCTRRWAPIRLQNGLAESDLESLRRDDSV